MRMVSVSCLRFTPPSAAEGEARPLSPFRGRQALNHVLELLIPLPATRQLANVRSELLHEHRVEAMQCCPKPHVCRSTAPEASRPMLVELPVDNGLKGGLPSCIAHAAWLHCQSYSRCDNLSVVSITVAVPVFFVMVTVTRIQANPGRRCLLASLFPMLRP